MSAGDTRIERDLLGEAPVPAGALWGVHTLRAREYVWTERRAFRPTDLGFQVNDYLVKHFRDIVNVEFTANMESDLDEVERGKA